MNNLKTVQALLLAVLAACNSATSTSSPDKKNNNDSPATQEPTPPATIAGRNLVVKQGGQVIAYYLDGSASRGRFLLPNGLIVKVDMWTGEIASSDAVMMYAAAGCSGAHGLDYDGVQGQVVKHLGSYYKLTERHTGQTVNSFNMGTDSSPNCQNTSPVNNVTIHDYEAVSPSDLPTFPTPIILEVE